MIPAGPTCPGCREFGLTSWLLLGIIGLIVVILLALGAVSGIVIPLVIAVMMSDAGEPEPSSRTAGRRHWPRNLLQLLDARR